MTLTEAIALRVLVSWDGSGAFTGEFDDVTGDVTGDTGVSIAAGKDGSRTLDPPKVVSAGFEVTNDDGTYSQERADSPVYQQVIPGRPVKIQALIGATGPYDAHTPYDETDPYDGVGTYDLARTAIDGISQTTDLGNYRVKFDTLGIESLLVAGTGVTVAVMTTPLVSDCVTALLNAVGWPVASRSIATSDTRLLYWWCDDRPPWDALLELLRAEGPGAIYVDGSGVFHFENRNYRTTTTRSNTSQGSFYDQMVGPPSPYDEHASYDAHASYDGRAAGFWFTALSYDPGFRNIYNLARYATRTRTLAGSASVVWSYGATLTLGASQSVRLTARPQDPFLGAVAPVLTTDYTVSGGTVAVSLSATSGPVTVITVTATSGVPTVSGLQLRAQPLTVVSETTVENAVDASASIARFSAVPGQAVPRVLQVGGWPEIDQPNAQAVCDAWVTRYMVQRTAVTVTLRPGDAALVLQMLRRTISDRITLRESNTGLASDVWVNAIRYEMTSMGFTTVLACEKVEEVGGAVWDLSLWDAPAAVWGV